MSAAAERLSQARRDLINEAVQAAVERERLTPTPARVVARPKVSEHRGPAAAGWHQPHHVLRAGQESELSLVKIGRRSFVQAEELDDFLERKQYDPTGRRLSPAARSGVTRLDAVKAQEQTARAGVT